jgi:inorganic pyrophosphatase
LDVIVLSHYSLHPGCIAKAKIIWVLHMVDWGEADDKILAVAYKDPFMRSHNDLEDLHKHTQNQIEHFLAHYKKLEGKHVDVSWFNNKAKALEIVHSSHQNYIKRKA